MTNLETFEQVAERRRGQFLWMAQRMTNNREEAEEIVQDALLKEFRSIPQFRCESKMDTWLCVIVRNTGLEWLGDYSTTTRFEWGEG
jgi:RNA polymerase sigma-70 factor (ECF subfamily)